MMPEEERKAALHRIYQEGWSKCNLAVFDEYYAANVVLHHPALNVNDREGMKAYCNSLFRIYPDLKIVIDDVLAAERDHVIVLWTGDGTETGTLRDGSPGNGKYGKTSGIQLYRFEGDKIVEEWETIGRKLV
jgi:predicted ester cyclase